MIKKWETMNNMNTLLSNCKLCPRSCGSDRLHGQKGYCAVAGENILVARAAPHYWEEPCISGDNGSGTVFFSGCNMGCLFCQNKEISRGAAGKEIDCERLKDIFFELQSCGVHNINLVTPTHYAPQIIKALQLSREEGLHIPIVYNSSGYEKVETLKLFEGLVDIWLPDFKYISRELSLRYSGCSNYADFALPALTEMHRQCPTPIFGSNGIMKKGVIVRHLCLPGCIEDSKAIFTLLHNTFGDDIYVSIMGQYTPFGKKLPDELNRKLSREEYDEIIDYAVDLGIENGFTQDLETADESFIPEFDNRGV